MMVRFGLMVAAATLAWATSPASAQNPQEQAVLRQHCSGDYMRLCNMYEPGSPQVEQCFQAKTAELTPNCRSAIASFTKKNPAGRQR